MAKQLITQQEYDYIQSQLTKLDETDQRLKGDLKHSLNVGSETWHDNDMFDTAKNQKLHADLERLELQKLLKSSEVVTNTNTQKIEIGTQVVIEDEAGNRLKLNLGGPIAARLGDDWISISSPIGKALLHKKAGDSVHVVLKDNEKVYSIIEVSLIK